MTKSRALAMVFLFAACREDSESVPARVFMTTPDTLTYCCDPSVPPPVEGYLVGYVTITNDANAELSIRAASALDVIVRDDPGALDVTDESFVLLRGGGVSFALYSDCVQADQTVTFRVSDEDRVVKEFTVTVKWDCPEEEPPPEEPSVVTILTGCTGTAAERIWVTDTTAPYDPFDVEIGTAGSDGGRCCTVGGTLLKEDPFTPYFGGTFLPEVPGEAPAALAFHGPSMLMVTSFDDATGEFGLSGIGGFGRSWTDIAPSGDPDATDHFLAVDFTMRRVAQIVPVAGVWGIMNNTDVVPTLVLDPAWGGPVTAVRQERSGDICLACEPNLTDPGNFVVVAMGGDDVADSAALIGPTGKQPRVLRGLDGIYGVACFGANVFSLFWKTATGYAKIGDEAVGGGPLGTSAKRLANGDVAFLVACSESDQVFVIIVDPLTGTVEDKTEIAVPPELDGTTDAAWGKGGEVFIIGKDSHNIAKIETGFE